MYYVQTQAPAGNFVDYLGTEEYKTAKETRDYLADRGEVSIVIWRIDAVVLDHMGKFI